MSFETDSSGGEINETSTPETPEAPKTPEAPETPETPESYDLAAENATEETENEKVKAEETPEDYDALVGDAQKAYPCEEMIDGERHYFDTNGQCYRIGDNLQPNATYELNGYTYQTDEMARISSAEGQLHMKDDRPHLPIKDSMKVVGKGDQLDTDDRGHLIGDQFNGVNRLENLVPQDSHINRVDFRNFENQLAKEVKNGKEVYVRVEPFYEGESRRPTEILVNYRIDDREDFKIFRNEAREKK